MKTTLILIMLSLGLSGQIQHTPDTLACNDSQVRLWASGGYSYTWTLNGATFTEQTNTSYFIYPYSFSGWVSISALTDNGIESSTLTVTFTECTNINETSPNSIEPVYFDLLGNKATLNQGQILIKQVGNKRTKVYLSW